MKSTILKPKHSQTLTFLPENVKLWEEVRGKEVKKNHYNMELNVGFILGVRGKYNNQMLCFNKPFLGLLNDSGFCQPIW